MALCSHEVKKNTGKFLNIYSDNRDKNMHARPHISMGLQLCRWK